jgi:pilus assembly protein CpaB
MRVSSRTLLLVIAGVIAAFTAISVRNRLSQVQVVSEPVVQVPISTRVIVARHDIAPGTFIQSSDLDWGVAPDTGSEATLHEGAVKLEDFNGAVVRREVHSGDPVPQSSVMKSGEGGFMSAVLDAGMRAVSIGVTATSGNAGFVSPGDHIDLIVTHHIKPQGNNANGTDTVVSETFVHNVRVVAIDQMLDNPDNKAVLAKTITVEVSPRQAEQVAVAEEMGKISVALRSLLSPAAKAAMKQPDAKPLSPEAKKLNELYGNAPMATTVDTSNYTRDSDISSMLEQKSATSTHVHVIRGDQIENLQF